MNNLAKFKKIVQSKIVAVDTETTGLNLHGDTVEAVSVSNGKLSVALRYKDIPISILETLLANKKQLKIFHNVYFDIHMFEYMRFTEFNNMIDTIHLAKIYNENLNK